MIEAAVLLVFLTLLFIVYYSSSSSTAAIDTRIRDLEGQIERLRLDLLEGQQQSTHEYEVLLGKHDKLSSKLDTYESKVSNKFNDISANFTTLYTYKAESSRLISRLSNHTSNADVLDQLAATNLRVSMELQQSKAEVSQALLEVERNVTIQLNNSQAQVNEAMDTLRSVVLSATGEIYEVQRNVTLQLSLMSESISETTVKLNNDVQQAQDIIQREVSGVREDIRKYIVTTNKQFDAENDFVKYQLAGTFTLIGCLISLWHMTSHLRHYHKPRVQRRIMAILWMVPIYGVTSWLTLVMPKFEQFFSAIRDCYEAYAVYTFIAILCAILEEGRGFAGLIEKLTKRVFIEMEAIERYDPNQGGPRPKLHMSPPWPFCYVNNRPISIAAAWLYQCKLMAMQFVILKPLLTMSPAIFKWMGVDYDGHPVYFHETHMINWRAPKLYVIILQNISVGVAFYGLLSFYHGTREDLVRHRHRHIALFLFMYFHLFTSFIFIYFHFHFVSPPQPLFLPRHGATLGPSFFASKEWCL